MANPEPSTIGTNIIKKLCLRQTEDAISAPLPPNARVFEYPGLEQVYVMESDLYGNPMPEGSCFLAFHGRVGLIGQHMTLTDLEKSTTADIEKLVASNSAG